MGPAMNFEVVTEGLQFPEGPIAMADGSVLVVEIRRQTLTRVRPDGTQEIVAELGGGPNGAAIGPDGAVYVCNNGGFEWHEADGMLVPGHKPADYVSGSIQRVDLASGAVSTLYDHCDGTPLRGPNDLVFDRTGGFWFSDLGKSTSQHRDQGALYYARPDGSHIVQARAELTAPNGVGLSPDQRTLYMADTTTGRLWALDLEAPGQLAPPPAPWLPGRVIATLPGFQLLDSLKVEAGGEVCVGTIINGGVSVFDPDGSVEHVALPELAITNLCFGGDDLREVWLTASTTGRLYRGRWPRPGLGLNYNG
ncbi:MAG: SMP-30/gluconolactonase/LRE family protein [Caulobacteraceae bacterium]|nr:SMP-30/gluconolactonase/LRE family protein [Caulobacteraceae bacterium]